MDRQKLAQRLIYLISFIFLANFLADKFYWYSSIWYFDMFMHTLGGLWVGLFFVYVFPPEDTSFKSIFKILFVVLLVGAGWEVFEAGVDKTITQNPFNVLDTMSDIFFDLAGGTLSALYLFRRPMFIKGSGVHPIVEL